MSTTMSLPTLSWASAHRALNVALTVALAIALAAAITLLVVPAIGTAEQETPSPIPRMNTGEDSCHWVLPGRAC